MCLCDSDCARNLKKISWPLLHKMASMILFVSALSVTEVFLLQNDLLGSICIIIAQ